MKIHLTIIVIFCMISMGVEAQDAGKKGSAAQANNPLANMTAINFHNYYIQIGRAHV